MRRSSFVASVAAAVLAGGATAVRAEAPLVVLAPLNSDRPLSDIIKAFAAKHGGATVRPFFGRPDMLFGQLAAGAPCDVFVSSIAELSAQALDKHLVDPFRPMCKLVPTIIVAKGNPLHITGLADLARKGVRLSVGDDATPIGRFTHAVIKRATKTYGADFPEKFEANVVSHGVNTKGVTGQVNSGSADAGIVFTSDLYGDEMQRAQEVPIDPALGGSIQNEIAVATGSTNKPLAKAFVDYVLSPDGQAVFHHYRFG
ncbi:MAG TPA: molybdate ABC transporter substrate-binding protein [Candidatus Sulfotelmatobacter sp.]|nr:molybdate ABC transporter substrate-binding protein [Candidatus Sulfotelmatobacter sp.]